MCERVGRAQANTPSTFSRTSVAISAGVAGAISQFLAANAFQFNLILIGAGRLRAAVFVMVNRGEGSCLGGRRLHPRSAHTPTRGGTCCQTHAAAAAASRK
jgi:hypothetical protein